MLQLNSPQIVAETNVIPAEEYQAYLDAQGIIQAAQTQAAQIIADANQEYEAQKQQGFEDGLTEGRMEMAEKMVDSIALSVDYFSSLEEKVVDIVMKSLKKILGEMDDQERVKTVVRHALAVARNQTKVIVRACPSEVEMIQSQVDEIMQPYPGINFIDIVPDSRLSAGGCILETDIGVIDASVEVQLNSIKRSLTRSLSGEK